MQAHFSDTRTTHHRRRLRSILVGKEVEGGNGSQVEQLKIGHIALIEALREFGEHHIAIVRGGYSDHAGTIAPEQFLFFFGRPIRLEQVGGAFDTKCAVEVASGLLVKGSKRSRTY